MKRKLIDLRNVWEDMDALPPFSISELERRMRPGASSARGFLGPTESLEAVMAQDGQTLNELGLSHGQIADALESTLECALDQRDELLKGDFEEYMRRDEMSLLRLNCAAPVENLPSTDTGYLVRDTLQVFIVQYRGFQRCPWGCEDSEWGSFDFLILNRRHRQCLTCPGLIVHLVRKHHFFEGLESPYRVDPSRVVQVLELGPRTSLHRG